MGQNANASATNAAALGTGAIASFAGSTAVGAGASTSRANQMALGTAGSTYTMAGLTSSASRSAQSGAVQIVTTDAVGNLASASTAELFDLRPVWAEIDRVSEGVAMAMAMDTPTLPNGKNMAVSAQWGTFGGQNALALSSIARIADDSFFVTGAIGVGFNEGTVGGKAGLLFAW
ncbi:autotransporter adhesin [Ancylobacter polymorphus]|uniref:Autotransporter adhesin n=1 Tax=Ancylobacter polymorphus TaxID=223390 RepID=A0ABU0BAA1_9HYPH|nr:autotransporter adhesin [Ancylobacter polymorphus]